MNPEDSKELQTENDQPEVELDLKNQGRVNAFDQMVIEFKKQVNALTEKAAANDGGRRACAVIETRLTGLSELIINRAKEGKSQRPPEDLQFVVEGIQRAGKMVSEVGQDFLQEHLMIKGEARALTTQIGKLHELRNLVVGRASRKAELAKEEEEFQAKKNGKQNAEEVATDGANA